MDRGDWWAIVHRIIKSQTQLKWLSIHPYSMTTPEPLNAREKHSSLLTNPILKSWPQNSTMSSIVTRNFNMLSWQFILLPSKTSVSYIFFAQKSNIFCIFLSQMIRSFLLFHKLKKNRQKRTFSYYNQVWHPICSCAHILDVLLPRVTELCVLSEATCPFCGPSPLPVWGLWHGVNLHSV